VRYDYRYHTGEIEELVAAVEGIRRQAQETYLITNNRFRRQAVLNALELQHRLRRAPGAGAAHAAHGLSGAGGPDACVGHGNMGDGGLGLTTSTRHEPSVCSRRPTSLARSSSLPNSRGGPRGHVRWRNRLHRQDSGPTGWGHFQRLAHSCEQECGLIRGDVLIKDTRQGGVPADLLYGFEQFMVQSLRRGF
jgi:hypothetical protein